MYDLSIGYKTLTQLQRLVIDMPETYFAVRQRQRQMVMGDVQVTDGKMQEIADINGGKRW